VTLRSLRGSVLALVLACIGWSAGCATPGPMMDPYYASGAYTPTRVAVLPPDVFVVLDQVGDNDDVKSAALGQAVSNETVRLAEQTLRARGYDVDLSARWDGIIARDGSVLVNRDELGWLANGVLQFGNSPAGGGHGPMTVPQYVAPELAAKVGWATQSDALLYVNVKGVTTTNGKRAASILAGVFIVFIVAAIVLAVVASSKGGGGGGSGKPSGLGSGSGGSGWRGAPVSRSAPSTGGGLRATPPGSAPAPSPGRGGWGGTPGRAYPARPVGAPVYGGGPHVGIGVGVWIPLDGPVYTHDGNVGHDDEWFAGDELYVSMTLVSTYDGRVLWHARENLDLDADDNRDVDRMVQSFLGQLPPRGGASVPAAATSPR
jgi:hypothetical protein